MENFPDWSSLARKRVKQNKSLRILGKRKGHDWMT